jgi:hypothetical protein
VTSDLFEQLSTLSVTNVSQRQNVSWFRARSLRSRARCCASSINLFVGNLANRKLAFENALCAQESVRATNHESRPLKQRHPGHGDYPRHPEQLLILRLAQW